jgi:GTP-binding protein
MFIDYTKIKCFAGKGGPGAATFRREKFIPKGGPDGGDGGHGGNIIVQVKPDLHTLHDIRYNKIYRAKNGARGGSSRKTGKNGADVFIYIPRGTLIKNSENGEIIADLIEKNDNIKLCKGGLGGRGNVHFKSSVSQSPRYAQQGLPGAAGEYEFELKVLADVGLVGLPNAGKSTLLSRISSATPKIADYPFTTLQPHLGIVKSGDFRSFVVADIPGLIKGASKGKGLGHRFLRHIERTKILVYLIDVNEKNPVGTFETLRNELVNYNPGLSEKSFLILRTKWDLVNNIEPDNWFDFGDPVIDISAHSGYGLNKLYKSLNNILYAK